MHIEDCELRGDLQAVMAPLTRTEPEEEWVKAADAGIVPASVFSLYRRTGFLSFGSSPRFLSDGNNYLFGYFSMILESIKSTLLDADEELRAFVAAQAEIFDLGKERRGESWDAKADSRAKNHFRMLVLSLCSSLDTTAELVALLLTNEIAGLRVGKAEFQKIEDWLKTPLPVTGVIVTPQRSKLETLHQKLCPIVEASAPEKDWLPLMKLFRNKAAHLGTAHFREIGFHDKNHRFYRFFPRRWPVLWEEHMQSPSDNRSRRPGPSLESMVGQFMRQDNVSYVRGLCAKVTTLIEAAFEVLDSAYCEFKDFPLNQAALSQLQQSEKAFAFEGFRV